MEKFFFCFNRTFMELKSLYLRKKGWLSPSFNRTFMELKCAKKQDMEILETVLIVPLWNWNNENEVGQTIEKRVLIVPLWNWNMDAFDESRLDIRFNRTFMELKYLRNIISQLENYSFNRTFMELKLMLRRIQWLN